MSACVSRLKVTREHGLISVNRNVRCDSSVDGVLIDLQCHVQYS